MVFLHSLHIWDRIFEGIPDPMHWLAAGLPTPELVDPSDEDSACTQLEDCGVDDCELAADEGNNGL